jgi:hypothetical protein
MKNRQTVVTGIVFNHLQVGVSHDGDGTMDSNPDRDNFTIIVSGGSEEMFREWFLEVADFSIVCYGDSMEFGEIGPSKWKIEEGAEISITFDEYMDALLNRLASNAHNAVNHLAWKALMSIGTN